MHLLRSVLALLLTACLGLVVAACAHPTSGSDLSLADACAGPGCTPDAGGCATDRDCSGGRHCGPARSCVQCVTSDQCADGQRCDGAGNRCVAGCGAGRGCGDGGVCEADAGLCVECVADGDCHDAASPRCDPATSRCVPCVVGRAGDCGAGLYCKALNGGATCAPGCQVDDDCPSVDGGARVDGGAEDGGAGRGVFCDPGTHQCSTGCNVPRSCGACGNVCPGGWNCCAAACSNPVDDVMNCGGCNTPCVLANATPQCVARQCRIAACANGYADCNGAPADGCETSTASNINNCGACNTPCQIPHALPRCAGGACLIDTCAGSYSDCNMNVADGCETDIRAADIKNCGGCALACSTNHIAAPSCVAGVCTGACDAGFTDCNKNKQIDGCEANTDSDVGNCGACGVACSGAHVTNSACAAGKCSGSCDAGYADCNMNLQADGCESPVAADANNCGGCNLRCSANNIGTPVCAGGACTGACNANFADCDNNKRSNGCETDITSNATACGACGVACSGMNIAMPTCVMGKCNGACNPGFADCDGNKLLNGCEAALTTVQNCGACGKACAVGQQCVAGMCTSPNTCSVKVNEIMTGTTQSGSNEFVEIFNPCPNPVDITNWRLYYRPASNAVESVYFQFTAPLAAGAYLVIGGANYPGAVDGRLNQGLSGTGGAVGIRDAMAILVDSVAYDTLTAVNSFTEGMPAPNPPTAAAPGNSISRIPSGADTNNNLSDFKISTMITPGAANQ